MPTLSQMVDEVVLETRRPDLRNQVVNYLNQTVREIHAEPQRGNVAFYSDNYRETQIVVDSVDRQSWVMPNLSLFQQEVAVRFDGAYHRDGRRVYAQKVTPGPRMESEDYYYYRAGETFVFGGVRGYGALGTTISIAYYEYPRSLKYYASANRPASYDVVDGWSYHDDFNTNDETREAARSLVTNWVLMRWTECIMEGLRAKIYKRLSDDVRQRTAYSLFMQMRMQLYTSEVADVSGPY